MAQTRAFIIRENLANN